MEFIIHNSVGQEKRSFRKYDNPQLGTIRPPHMMLEFSVVFVYLKQKWCKWSHHHKANPNLKGLSLIIWESFIGLETLFFFTLFVPSFYIFKLWMLPLRQVWIFDIQIFNLFKLYFQINSMPDSCEVCSLHLPQASQVANQLREKLSGWEGTTLNMSDIQ